MSSTGFRIVLRLLLPGLPLWLLSLSLAAGVQSAPELASRGIKAYRNGDYHLARILFERALQIGALHSREDWMIMAGLNLADLALDAGEAAQALSLLERLPKGKTPELRAATLWKQSQAEHLAGRHGEALEAIDAALGILGESESATGERSKALITDRFRYLFHLKPSVEWKADYEGFKRTLTKEEKSGSWSLDALILMRIGRYSEAMELWHQSVEYFRSRRQFARAAAGLNYLAVCQAALGKRPEATETNLRAVLAFSELGLVRPGLKAKALGLFLSEDPGTLAELRSELDVVAQGVAGFDQETVLEEYRRYLPAPASTR